MPNAYPKGGSRPANDPALPTILIVHNHERIRAALLGWLSGAFPDCRFLEATSGEEAVALTVIQPADMVLVNMRLPHMTGVQATRRVKRISPRTQVVIMSLYEETCYRADAETAGASAFVAMRTIPVELIPTLASLLDQAMTLKAKDEPAFKL